jgi:FkbM family methyltransferase
MKKIIVNPASPWRAALPLLQKIRRGYAKLTDRLGKRLIISGGRIGFLDTELNFPEGVALLYSTSLFWEGPLAYELATSRAIALLARHSRVFFDIGSNMGLYAVYAGVACKQTVTYAFEPVPDIWRKNCAFHEANQLPVKNVIQAALSDRDGSQNIFIPVYSGAVEVEQTATLRADSWQANHEKVEQVAIQCVTLDTFTAGLALPAGRCSLKIDVENFEAAVLRGGRKFIQERRPWMVCEILPREGYDAATKTLHNDNGETVRLLGELNYAAFAITNDGFFRFAAADFARPREMKDFLLVPAEQIAGDAQYLSDSSVADLLSAV